MLLFCSLHLAILFVACAIVSAQKELDCKLKNVTFGPLEERMRTCDFKFAKFGHGKAIKFNSDFVANHSYHELRIRFLQSHIQTIPTALFDEFKRVEVLELNGVGLRNIYKESFAEADRLKVLQLYGNKLSILEGFAFAGAIKLEFLDISSNQLININHEAFKGLENLKELSLSNNRLSIIDDQTFHPCKDLTWIWLDRNLIKIVSVNLLVGNEKLIGLNLNDNKISALSTIIFDKLPNLMFLFLANNNCTSKNFINTKIAKTPDVKKDLLECFKEFRAIIPDEEERFRLKNVLVNAENANKECESSKANLLEQLETTRQKLTNLQIQNGN